MRGRDVVSFDRAVPGSVGPGATADGEQMPLEQRLLCKSGVFLYSNFDTVVINQIGEKVRAFHTVYVNYLSIEAAGTIPFDHFYGTNWRSKSYWTFRLSVSSSVTLMGFGSPDYSTIFIFLYNRLVLYINMKIVG